MVMIRAVIAPGDVGFERLLAPTGRPGRFRRPAKVRPLAPIGWGKVRGFSTRPVAEPQGPFGR